MSSSISHVLTENLTSKDGIYFVDGTDVATVWNTLAKENPTNAVISSPNEEDAIEKSRPQIEHLLSHLNDGIVLDLGCGYGRIAKYLLPKKQYLGYIGADSSSLMLSLFKERYAHSSSEQGTPALFVLTDIDVLPFKDASINNVIVSAVFLHNPKKVVHRSLVEVERVLAPGGKMLVYASFPNSQSLMGLQAGIYHFFRIAFGNPDRNGPVRFYGRGEVKRLFKNYRSVEVYPVGFAVLPKRIIILPGILGTLYRVLIAKPINNFFEAILPSSTKKYFCTHHDVIATK